MAEPQTRQEIFSIIQKKDLETNYDYVTNNMAAHFKWVQEEINKYAKTFPFMRGATTKDYFNYSSKLIKDDINEEQRQLHEISQTTPLDFWKAVRHFRSIYCCIRSHSMHVCSLH